MSIAKPALKNPWASSGSANIASPGGANETGIPSGANSIPRRWLNWILNAIETTVRYLLGRGIPDFDSSESYSIGDRVQWGESTGMTFVCIVETAGDGGGANSPGVSPSNWARWANGIPPYNALNNYMVGDTVFASDGTSYVCLIDHGVGNVQGPLSSPTYWTPWGHTDADIVALILGNTNTVRSTASTGISATSGTIVQVIDSRIGYGGTPLRDLAFTVASASNGYVDITLSGGIAFETGIFNVQFTSTVPVSAALIPYAEINDSNVVRIHCTRSTGSAWSGYVRLLGY